MLLNFVFGPSSGTETRHTQTYHMTKLTVTDLIGIIKDKASQSKAALLSKRTTLSLLRATSHDSFTPPTHKQISTLLSSGDGSRATASATIEVLMDRLQRTQNSAVALKCLIAVHHIIKHGSFILQDQLSVYPSSGGRNYLKLSNFRDSSSSISWELSSWVRWFAQHIEQLLCTSRILGFFLGASSSGTATPDRESQEEKVSGLANVDLLIEFDLLLTLVEGIGKTPDPASTKGNRLVDEIVNLVREDSVAILSEVSVRVNESRERLGCVNFGEAVELVCGLKRLEKCKERMMMMMMMMVLEVGQEQRLWDLVGEVKDKAGMEVFKEEGKLNKGVRKQRMSESDRFSGRVLNSADLVRFRSGRLL